MSRYYDLVLGLIPLAFVAFTAVATALGFGFTVAVPGASLVAVGLIGHAMFVNGPVDDAPRTSADETSFQAAD